MQWVFAHWALCKLTGDDEIDPALTWGCLPMLVTGIVVFCFIINSIINW
jgi:hypothetical protein